MFWKAFLVLIWKYLIDHGISETLRFLRFYEFIFGNAYPFHECILYTYIRVWWIWVAALLIVPYRCVEIMGLFYFFSKDLLAYNCSVYALLYIQHAFLRDKLQLSCLFCSYQEAIEDITMRMGAGMAKFICKEVCNKYLAR